MNFRPSVFATFALFSALPAQAPAIAPLDADLATLHTVLVDRPGDGNVWVLAPGYKARFGRDGVDFIPWFGSKAPRNYPLAMRLRDVARGGRTLAWRADVEPRLEGLRVIYDRGAVQEVWDLRAQEVEQNFLVVGHEGDGDLVVDLAIDTELAASDVADGLEFAAAGLGRVLYGDVTTIDESARRVTTPARLTTSGIELRVPAAFVARAQGAVRIDPIVRAITIDNTVDAVDPDVAYEPNNDRWLVVYERVFSFTDQDIVSRRYSGSGNLIEEVGVATNTRESRNPSVGVGAAARDFLIVWDEDRTVGRQIRGRVRAADSTTQTATSDLATDSGVNDVPQVGGVAATDSRNGDYLVVFANHNFLVSQSQVCMVRVDANGFSGPSTTLSSPSDFAGDAAINKVRRTNLGWVVAWRTTGTTSSSARARLVTATAVAPGSLLLQTGIVGPPAVAGDGVDFEVVFADQAGRSDFDVFGAQLRQQAGSLVQGIRHNLTAAEPGARVVLNQADPTVGFDGSRFTYAYREGPVASTDTDVFAATFTAGPTPFFSDGHRALHTATSGIAEGTPSIAGQAETGGDAGRFLIAWQQVGSSSSNVLGALYDGVQPGSSVEVVDTHCGALQISFTAENTPALGATVRLRAANIQAANQVTLLGLPTPPITLCSAGCKLGVFPILLTVPGTSLDLRIPEDPSVLGARVAAENVLVLNLGGCTTANFVLPLVTTDTLVLTVR